MTKPKWLDRSLIMGPYICVCLDEQSYDAAMEDLKISHENRAPWISRSDAQATTHVCPSPKGGIACVVCVRPWNEEDQIPLAGLLVHEAVHVFQEYCARVGERTPSAEFEAYSIQWIAQQLMWGYTEALKEMQCPPPKAKSKTRSRNGSSITAWSRSASPTRLNS